jgi:hypothetical protein
VLNYYRTFTKVLDGKVTAETFDNERGAVFVAFLNHEFQTELIPFINN